jgi:hypothetical protein
MPIRLVCAGTAGVRSRSASGGGSRNQEPARHSQLHATVGQEHGDCSEGGASCVDSAGEPGAGGEQEAAAERIVDSKGGDFRAEARRGTAGRRRPFRRWPVCTTGSSRILLDGIREWFGQWILLQLRSRRASSPSAKRRRGEESVFRSLCQRLTTEMSVPLQARVAGAPLLLSE